MKTNIKSKNNIKNKTRYKYKNKKMKKTKQKSYKLYKLKKSLSKINNKNIKQIYIKNKAGFGNKVFDLIFSIYLYNLYEGKCIINYVLVKSQHEKEKDPILDKIFPNASSKIKFITERQYQNINYNRAIKINKIYNTNPIMIKLESFPRYDELSQYTKIDNNFRLVYKMYETFGKDDKDIFINMNTSLINKNDKAKITKYTNLLSTNINTQTLDSQTSNTQIPYAIIHIRYGDKFYSLIRDIKTPKFDYFLLYTPQYYIDMINMLLKQNIPVIIITDSISLVKEFIMPSFSRNPKVNLLDIHWLAGFYLLCHASHIVMSCSSFSICSSYFNENAKCHIVIYHESTKDKDTKDKSTMPEEDAIAPNWEINKERKYILNYNKKLFLSMID